MAKTSYVEIPAGSEDLFLRGLKSGDRFQHARIVRNDTLLSKRRKAGVRVRSLLPQISALWAGFSDSEKAAWISAASNMNLTGWQLFVQDQSIRILNDIAGVATPATTHQSWVGEISLSGDATEIKLFQSHPFRYWIIKKVYGKKGMYQPVEVIESFGLPLQIGISVKSALTSAGADPFARFYAVIKNSYQGRDDETEVMVDIPLSHGWQRLTSEISTLRGTIIGYNLFIHLHDVTGSLFFDNIQATHNAHNWARDPYCKQVATTFTKQYQQIPKHWAPLILPDGAEYDSVYVDS